MKTLCGTFLILSLFTIPTHTQVFGFPEEHRDPILEQKLTDLARGFQGTVGIYVRHLKTGTTATFNVDSLFPTASMIKVPILCGLFDRIDRGELNYDSAIVYRDSMKYDDGITGSFKDSTRIAVAELVHLMITLSDNTASLWLQALSGSGAAINDFLEKNGFHSTRVNSRTPGREGYRSIYGWGVASPREMAELMASIYQQKLISEAASEEMFRVLTKPYWDGEAVSQIPPQVQVASKSGAVNASKSETVLVNAPSGDYVFCVITKNQKDQRWENDNEGYVFIRSVSRILWSYFEPQSTWKPPTGRNRWIK